jgi:hypothetical protein
MVFEVGVLRMATMVLLLNWTSSIYVLIVLVSAKRKRKMLGQHKRGNLGLILVKFRFGAEETKLAWL